MRQSPDELTRRSARSPQNPHLADTPRDPVRVEPLEEELRVTPSRTDEIAEARERDLARRAALRRQHVLRHVERVSADREAVTEAHEPPARLEEAREVVVGDLRRADPCGRELRLESGSLSARGRRASRLPPGDRAASRVARTAGASARQRPRRQPAAERRDRSGPQPRFGREARPRTLRAMRTRAPTGQRARLRRARRRGRVAAHRHERARRSSRRRLRARGARRASRRGGAEAADQERFRRRASSRREGSRGPDRAATIGEESRSWANRSPRRTTRAGELAVPRCTVTRAPSSIGCDLLEGDVEPV